jgi:hypothetical protein
VAPLWLSKSLQLTAVLVVVAGCRSRGTAEAEEPEGPVPMCATTSATREHVESASLVIDVVQDDICASGDPTTIEIARVSLEQSPNCPSGKVFLETGGGPDILLPDYAARLDRRALSELRSALGQFIAADRNTHGKAFVVSCTEPRWLLVATGNSDPRATLFTVPPPSPSIDEDADPSPGGSMEDPPPRDAVVTGTCAESLDVGKQIWTGRSLATGIMAGPSRLTTWTLGRTGDDATLVIQERFAKKKSGPPANDQPEGTWACARSTVWKGTVRGTPLTFSLSQGPNGQRLELSCSKRTLAVADTAARRVRVPSSMEGCNASRWAPGAKRKVSVLVCESLADTAEQIPLFVTDRPGVEYVTYDNECGDPATALRRIPRDGGVSTAVRISEQPDAYVPAGLRRSR